MVLQQPTQVKDSLGGITHVYSTVKTVWAAVEPMMTSEVEFGQQQEIKGKFKITIRWPGDGVALDETWRVLWKGDVYSIDGADNKEQRNREITLTCTVVK